LTLTQHRCADRTRKANLVWPFKLPYRLFQAKELQARLDKLETFIAELRYRVAGRGRSGSVLHDERLSRVPECSSYSAELATHRRKAGIKRALG
jgi:hypothetical protein